AGAEGRLASRGLALAGGEDAAHVHLLHVLGRNSRALDGGGKGARPEGVRRKARERTLENSDRRAHRAQDDDVVHDLSCGAVLEGELPAALAAGGTRGMLAHGTMRPAMETALKTLGIDFGEKRIGLAISDPAGRVAVPLATWSAATTAPPCGRSRRSRAPRESGGWCWASRWASTARAGR